MNAASISRELRTMGFNPVAASDRNREGLRVTNSATAVRVSADLDAERAAVAMAQDAFSALRDAGYDVRTSGTPRVGSADAVTAFYVHGRV